MLHALVQGVLDSPDADAGRLVLADWLEEHGDPRAGWLRVVPHTPAGVPASRLRPDCDPELLMEESRRLGRFHMGLTMRGQPIVLWPEITLRRLAPDLRF